MTSIIGIDPGEKTGIGLYDTVTQNRDFIEVEGGYDGFLKWVDDSYPLLSSVDIVIVEKFTLRSQEFVANTTPLEIMGMLKYFEHIGEFRNDLVWCTPAQHKSLISDAAMKRGGMYPPRGQVKGGHSADGMRLICWYMVSKLRDREFSERLFPKD